MKTPSETYAAPLLRREVLLGAGTLAAGSVLAGCLPRSAGGGLRGLSVVVDAHCHVFNGNDLPVAGFLDRLSRGMKVPGFLVDLLHGAFGRLEVDAQRSAPGLTEREELLATLGSRSLSRALPPQPLSDDQLRDLVSDAPAYRGAPGERSLRGETDPAWLQLERKLQKASGEQPEVREWLEAEATRAAQDDRGASRGLFTPLLDILIGWLRRTVPFLDVGFHSRKLIADSLLTDNQEATLLVPMLVDFDAWQPGLPAPVAPRHQVQLLELISKLSIAGLLANPTARVHPFVAFDPRREVADGRGVSDPVCTPRPWASFVDVEGVRGSLQLARTAVECAGFIGVKLYPPVGFKPALNEGLAHLKGLGGQLDAALERLYAWCERSQVPITAHSGPGNPFAPEFETFAQPDNWRPVLARHPALHVNFGHFGHLARTGDDYWLDQALRLMRDFPHVYADLSDSDEPLSKGGYLDALHDRVKLAPLLKQRLIYGSDWFMNKLVVKKPETYLGAMREKLDERFKDPEFSRQFLGLNALKFLGLDGPGQARDRLVAFYGTHPLPAWLGGVA